MVHVAVIGSGRVGGEVAFTLAFERYVTRLSLVDVAPKVSEMVKEELAHAIANHVFDIHIDAYNAAEDVEDADLIVVAAGFPRTPGMSRRELAGRNAGIVKAVVEATVDKNPRAWYFIITNPVDAMSTLASRILDDPHKVVGTGTNLETSRFRTILARELGVPCGMVEAYVGGEHGDAAVLLWSTVKVDGEPLNEYVARTGKKLEKQACEEYVKDVSQEIIRVLGGTRHGPAGSFIEIIRGIVLNTGKIMSYSRLRTYETTPTPVHVTVPARIARSLGPDLWESLAEEERKAIKDAAGIVHRTFSECAGEYSC